MKLIFLALVILSSVSLTSCWQTTEKVVDITESTVAEPEPFTYATTNNIIYLHTMVTRGQEPKAILDNYIRRGNVVVDFYADWCRPCTLMGNVINQVAAQFPSVTFLKVDVDQFESLSANIRSLPTLIFYKNGARVSQEYGFKDKNNFTALLKRWY
jgi:thioredoxin 1